MKQFSISFFLVFLLSACSSKCLECTDNSRRCKPADMTNKEWKKFAKDARFTDIYGNEVECDWE